MRIKHAQQIHNSTGSDKARAVVACRARNIRSDALEETRESVKHARAGIGQKSEGAEWIRRPGRKHIAAQEVASHRQARNGDEKHERPAPPTKKQVPESGYDPCRERVIGGVVGLLRGGS